MKNVILYLTMVLIWGSTWFAIKFQLGTVDPMVSISYRFLLAAIILFVYSLISGRRLKFGLKEHGFIFLQGLFSFTFAYWLVYLAEIKLTSGLVAVICSSLIFMNIFNRSFFLRLKINWLVFIGAAVGVGGIVLIFWSELRTFSFSDGNHIAIMMAFLATLIYSLGNIVVERNIRNRIPVIQSNAIGMGYAALVMLLLAVISRKSIGIDLRFPYLLSLSYLAVFGSVIAFYCFFTLIGNIGSDKAAYGPVITPVIALAISTFFEGYHWSGYAITGILLLMIGNLLVINKKTMESA